MNMTIKRVYEPYSGDDGWRVLIDRLWPRGLSKEKAHIDDWQKELAPSNDLRHWFNHDVAKWKEFESRYISELDTQSDVVGFFLSSLKKHAHVTLLYAAHDEEHNNAVVLLNYLENRISRD
ncbi:DUF488 domain-containing protein [Bartonella sp. M0283]|uniref:DUF488 domain-containing protein n=1 Tax=Bartonella sp. M0283 TaxID=2751016 RepID=UPI0018DB37EA|nr:DUF488 domain-containing protein [Bartonella sp. M0283]MBI0163288.1 DUF488 domain-containing protein [Bartonella sp. M0283]